MTSPRAGALAGAARVGFAIALSAYLGVAAWLVWRTSVLEPYSDMLDWLERWRRFQADGDLAAYLWSPHNFHHLVWTFAVMGLDIRAFGAQGYLFLATGAASLAATAAMLAWLGAAAAGRGLRLIGGGVAAALSLMGCHVLDATAAINITYLHALVFAVAAILLAEGADRPARRLGALACAVAAGVGNAAGLAVWPALVIQAWRRGDRRWALTLLAVGGVFSLVFLLGETAPGGAQGVGLGARFANAALLLVNYLGLPWVRGLPGVGWLIGLAALGAGLAAVLFRGGREASQPERTAVTLVLFSLTTAAMAGAARTGMIAPGLVPMRYAVFLVPMHVGFWVLALPSLRRIEVARPRAWAGLIFGASALMLVHQTVMGVYAVRTGDANLRLLADFKAGRRAPEMTGLIYPDFGKAKEIYDWTARGGLYQTELRKTSPGSP